MERSPKSFGRSEAKKRTSKSLRASNVIFSRPGAARWSLRHKRTLRLLNARGPRACERSSPSSPRGWSPPPRAADGKPMPLKDQGLVGTEQLFGPRRQAKRGGVPIIHPEFNSAPRPPGSDCSGRRPPACSLPENLSPRLAEISLRALSKRRPGPPTQVRISSGGPPMPLRYSPS